MKKYFCQKNLTKDDVSKLISQLKNEGFAVKEYNLYDVGEQISVPFNGFGNGYIESYFVEGWNEKEKFAMVGFIVDLYNPPQQWVEQQRKQQSTDHPIIMLFNAEINLLKEKRANG